MNRLFAIALFLAATAAPLAATPPAAHAQEAGQTGRQAPLSRVLKEIAERQPGRHLNTTMGDEGGRPVYFVQWQLADGRVVIFVVDAGSGQILRRQGG